MSEYGERFRKVAATFSDRVEGVSADGWESPAPCEGWVARDVIKHLVEWMPPNLFAQIDHDEPTLPSVDEDPVGAWTTLRDAVQAALDDPATASKQVDTPMGKMAFDEAVHQLATSDILVHTWDLARATGQDETIDATEAKEMHQRLVPVDELIRQTGMFGPKVEVPQDADDATKMLAFTGRTP